ncbi:MAG: hypothetical protein ABR599_00225 [Gemmatimonadota bacterium]
MNALPPLSFRPARVLLIAAICALAAVTSLATPVHQPRLAAQGARYLVLAESLTRGSYKLISSPTRESEISVPPLWPAALGVALAVSPTDSMEDFVPVAQGLTLALFLAFLVILFLFLEQRAGGATAAVVTLLLAVHPVVVPFARNPTAEVPFTLLFAGALWAGESALRRRDPARLWWAFALALAAAYVRLSGALLVLVLAWVAWGAFPAHRRAIVALTSATLLWPARQAAVALLEAPSTATLAEQFQHALDGRPWSQTVVENLGFYPRSLVEIAFPTDLLQDPLVEGLLLVALWGVVATGLALGAGRDRGLAAGACLTYLAGLLAWPHHELRYLVPVLWLVLAFAAFGVRKLVELVGLGLGVFRRPERAALSPLLLLLLLLPYVRWTLEPAEEGRALQDEWRGYYRGLAWADARAPERTVFVTRYPEDAFIRTERPVLPPEAGWPLIRERPAERHVWVVRDAFTRTRGFPISSHALSVEGARVEFVDPATGVEVWSLPQRRGNHAEAARRLPTWAS